jgi:hypothetical protein
MLRNLRIIPGRNNSNFYVMEVSKKIDSFYKFSFRTEPTLCLDVEAIDSYNLFCSRFPMEDGYKVRLIKLTRDYVK